MKNIFTIMSMVFVLCSCSTQYQESKTYKNCKVIKLERKQDFTNFIWENNITFVSNSDTVIGIMNSEDAIRLYNDIKKSDNNFTLHIKGKVVSY